MLRRSLESLEVQACPPELGPRYGTDPRSCQYRRLPVGFSRRSPQTIAKRPRRVWPTPEIGRRGSVDLDQALIEGKSRRFRPNGPRFPASFSPAPDGDPCGKMGCYFVEVANNGTCGCNGLGTHGHAGSRAIGAGRGALRRVHLLPAHAHWFRVRRRAPAGTRRAGEQAWVDRTKIEPASTGRSG